MEAAILDLRTELMNAHCDGRQSDLAETSIQAGDVHIDYINAFSFDPSDCRPSTELALLAMANLAVDAADGGVELARLIGADHYQSLIEAYVKNQPVVLRGHIDPGRFAHLYTREHLRNALNRGNVDLSHVRLATKDSRFCTEEFFGDDGDGTRPLGDRIHDFIEQESGTFTASRIFNHSTDSANLTNLLGRVFKARMSAAVFITGSYSQAFPLHWDTFDTILFQVDGKKVWSIFEPIIRSPLKDIHYSTRYDLSDANPLFETTLAAGDIMLVPRGYPHSVRSETAQSTHLSMGIQTPTWLEYFHTVLSQAIVVARSMESFRSDCLVSTVKADDRTRPALSMFDQFVSIARKKIMDDSFIVSHAQQSVQESAAGYCTCNYETEHFHRKAGYCVVEQHADSVQIRWHTKIVELPRSASSTASYIAKRSTFSLKDLPNELTPSSKRRLVSVLCREGLLFQCAANGASANDCLSGPPNGETA